MPALKDFGTLIRSDRHAHIVAELSASPTPFATSVISSASAPPPYSAKDLTNYSEHIGASRDELIKAINTIEAQKRLSAKDKLDLISHRTQLADFNTAHDKIRNELAKRANDVALSADPSDFAHAADHLHNERLRINEEISELKAIPPRYRSAEQTALLGALDKQSQALEGAHDTIRNEISSLTRRGGLRTISPEERSIFARHLREEQARIKTEIAQSPGLVNLGKRRKLIAQLAEINTSHEVLHNIIKNSASTFNYVKDASTLAGSKQLSDHGHTVAAEMAANRRELAEILVSANTSLTPKQHEELVEAIMQRSALSPAQGTQLAAANRSLSGADTRKITALKKRNADLKVEHGDILEKIHEPAFITQRQGYAATELGTATTARAAAETAHGTAVKAHATPTTATTAALATAEQNLETADRNLHKATRKAGGLDKQLRNQTESAIFKDWSARTPSQAARTRDLRAEIASFESSASKATSAIGTMDRKQGRQLAQNNAALTTELHNDLNTRLQQHEKLNNQTFKSGKTKRKIAGLETEVRRLEGERDHFNGHQAKVNEAANDIFKHDADDLKKRFDVRATKKIVEIDTKIGDIDARLAPTASGTAAALSTAERATLQAEKDLLTKTKQQLQHRAAKLDVFKNHGHASLNAAHPGMPVHPHVATHAHVATHPNLLVAHAHPHIAPTLRPYVKATRHGPSLHVPHPHGHVPIATAAASAVSHSHGGGGGLGFWTAAGGHAVNGGKLLHAGGKKASAAAHGAIKFALLGTGAVVLGSYLASNSSSLFGGVAPAPGGRGGRSDAGEDDVQDVRTATTQAEKKDTVQVMDAGGAAEAAGQKKINVPSYAYTPGSSSTSAMGSELDGPADGRGPYDFRNSIAAERGQGVAANKPVNPRMSVVPDDMVQDLGSAIPSRG